MSNLKDIYGQALGDIGIGGITEADGSAPVLISAVASDGSGGLPGIQTGDEVRFEFSESIVGPPYIDADNIDSIFISEKTFLSGSGELGPFVWSGQNSIVTVSLSIDGGEPSIAPLFNTTTDTMTFIDSAGNVSSSTVVLSGDFGIDNSSPTIIYRWTRDLDYDGYIDAIQIYFDKNIYDSSTSISGIDVAGLTGEAFSSTTNGDIADDGDIYITFPDGILLTDATPLLSCAANAVKMINGNGIAESNETCSDKAPPAILDAAASDGSIYSNGVDSDDRITIIFSEKIPAKPTIDMDNINTVFLLSGSTGWQDVIGIWNSTGNVLTLNFGASAATDTVKEGDVITVSSVTLQLTDVASNICISSIAVSGLFAGVDSMAPQIVSCSPASGDSGIPVSENIVIVFNEKMDSENTKSAIKIKAIKNKDFSTARLRFSGCS